MFGIGKGVRIGKLFGVEIELDYTWFLIFAFLVYAFSKFYEGNLFPFGVLVGGFLSILFFVSLLFHEFSHIALARLHGISVSKVRMFIFGAAAYLESLSKTPKAEFLIAIAGPVASFVAAGIFLVTSVVTSSLTVPEFLSEALPWFVFINIFLGAFNLIPAFPLDGGRCLSAVLWKLWQDEKRAIKTCSTLGERIGQLFIIMGAVSLASLFVGFYVPILIHPVWAIVIGWVIKDAARSQYFAYLLMTTKVRDIDYEKNDRNLIHELFSRIGIKNFCSEDDTLSNVIKKMAENKMQPLIVCEGDDIKGVIFNSHIWRFLQANK